ncbi:chemotaxis protein CheW [Pseudoalteromonas rubra]|uniref:Chemotaxis protein CheW n=1 Tax=Pseudoalteromonas rubra TaxID=43658 RepID=A0A5S3WK70_9GAMM|nr:chemotaxis protein CheW [Pseudoalteromonas rubra]TMP27069.1 chemotaxis protein CheW [Pseudoalteromonas rubra]TMP36166.1 chemotaxis protein CheW [Pseudoalteromonas rubra]
MSKHLFANEQVMKQYLGALLREEEEDDVTLAPVAKLLESVPEAQEGLATPSPAEQSVVDDVVTEALPEQPTAEPSAELTIPQEVEPQEQVITPADDLEITENTTIIKEEAEQAVPARARDAYLENEFQALFFEVAGLTLAVPLKSLGGIHQLTEVNQLFGKPKWFKGVMLNREEKLNVVDTARWVMPEKFTPELEEKLNYQYLIMLGDSQWGLLAENLVNNITLKPEDVKWRTADGKRPWLAGVIKEKMCALIDVENLNRLLEHGLDSREQ